MSITACLQVSNDCRVIEFEVQLKNFQEIGGMTFCTCYLQCMCTWSIVHLAKLCIKLLRFVVQALKPVLTPHNHSIHHRVSVVCILLIYILKWGSAFFLCSSVWMLYPVCCMFMYFICNEQTCNSFPNVNYHKVWRFQLQEYAVCFQGQCVYGTNVVGMYRYFHWHPLPPKGWGPTLQITICCGRCLFSFPHSFTSPLYNCIHLQFPVLCSLCPDWSPCHLPWTFLAAYVQGVPGGMCQTSGECSLR
jgi:hypothetical protein